MPISFPQTGKIQLFRGTTKLGDFNSETAAVAAALNDWETYATKSRYTLKYPDKEIDLSTLTRVVFDPDITPPSAPIIVATTVSASAISVALTFAATDAQSSIASYRVEYKRTVDSTWTVAQATLTAGQFPVSISGLTGSTGYDTRCRATDSANNVGPYSATSSATTFASSGGSLTRLTDLILTSAATNANRPWTFGHAFAQTDVPSGSFVGTDQTAYQVDVRNRWGDGSVKFAVISGYSSFTQNVAKTVSVGRIGTAPSGSVPEPTPAALGSAISVTLTGVGAGTYTPQTAATNGATAWNRTTARKVREFLGPVMSELHYYSPTSDAHLTIWWHVRVYSGGEIWVETIIEQGWTKIAGPTAKTYTANVVIGGSSKFNSSVNHRHHARWSRQDWVGTDPQVTPKHDRAYLGTTKMVPNYANIAIGTTMLNGYVQSALPMTIGNFELDGTQGGAHTFLGILPEWEAAYVISGDVRAYRAMLANEQAGNCGSLGILAAAGPSNNNGLVTRDESTGLPASPTDYGSDSYDTGGSLVAGTGTTIWNTDVSHSWAGGYLAYLVTGRWFSLETCQHLCAVEFLSIGNYTSGSITRIADLHLQDRGVAWAMRTACAALAITPDSGHALRAKYVTYVQAIIAKWRTNEVGLNNLGIRQHILNNTDSSYGPSPYGVAGMFQMYFLTQAFAFARDVASTTLSVTAQGQFDQTVAFHCSMPVGMLGVRPGGFCYKQAANYGLVVGPSPGSFFSSFGAWYDACVSAGQLSNDACSLAGALTGGNFPLATSYWGNFLPAISAAVDAGVSGAQAAYDRMTAASNWNTFLAQLPNAPQWAVLPRASAPPVVVGVPVYVSSMTTDFQVRALTSAYTPTNGKATPQSVVPSVAPNDWQNSDPGTNDGNYIDYWTSAAWDAATNTAYLFGIGHNNGYYNGLHSYGFSGTSAPTGFAVIPNSYSTTAAVGSTSSSQTQYSDGKISSRHTYSGTEYADGYFYVFGGIMAGQPGGFTNDVWRCNVSTGAWTSLGNAPLGTGSGDTRPATVYDPVTKKILLYRANISGYAFFNTVTQTWGSAKTFSASYGTNDVTLALDTNRNQVVIFGADVNGVLPINFTNATVGGIPAESIGTPTTHATGGIFSQSGITPIFDAARDVFWVLGGRFGSPGYTTLYEINASTFASTTHAITGISVGSDNQGSFRKGALLFGGTCIGFISSYTAPAYVIKLPAASSSLSTFSTDFSTTENPIDPTLWYGGLADGLLWENIRSSGGIGYGALPSDGPGYNDALAIRKGTFASQQFVKGTFYLDPSYSNGDTHECHLHILSSITSNNVNSYEFTINRGDTTVQMVRYNGGNADLSSYTTGGFTTISGSLAIPGGGFVSGDTFMVRASIVSGNPRFTLFKNDVQFCVMEDSQSGKKTSGAPAFGTFRRTTGGATDPLKYAWTAIEGGEY